jgi:RNA polymerase sigma-70 factor (ECF subfamily)
LFYDQKRDAGAIMSGDSVPWTLPLSRFAANDREATTLFGELRKPLLRYLACLGLSSDEAQDVVQDAFLRLHRHLHAGGSQENIRSWLFRVAHNQARNHQASYYRRFSDPLEPDTTGQLLDESTPERTLLEKEKFRRLGAAIRTLGRSERECLLLRASGLRYREIGEVLGIATSTVADTVDRAIKKLAEKCNV